MDQGYIKLYRKSLESGIMKSPKVWTFWCWCLLKASYKTRQYTHGFTTVMLEPGEFIFSRSRAATELGLGEQSIRSAVSSLKDSDRLRKVTEKSTNKFSVMAIVNWQLYQAEADAAGNSSVHTGFNGRLPDPHTEEGAALRKQADDVIAYLNEKQGKHYQYNDSIRRPVMERIWFDNQTVEDCKYVIDIKAVDPHFKENPSLFSPRTLFKSDSYFIYRAQTEQDFKGEAKGKVFSQVHEDQDEPVDCTL